MKYNLIALAVTPGLILLSAADSVPDGCVHESKWGNAVVVNDCDDPAYYVFDNQPKTSTIAPSATLSVPMYTKEADGGGGNIKLFVNPNTDLYAKPAQPVTQFEFTPTDSLEYFDISNVNSNIGQGKNGNGEDCEGLPPFVKGGLKIEAPDVAPMSCEPGANPCKTAYSKNDDNFATSATKNGGDVKLTLCPKGGSSSDSKDDSGNDSQKDSNEGSGASSSSALSSTPTPTSTPQPAPKAPKMEQKNEVPQSPSEDEDVVWVTHVVTTTVGEHHKRGLPTPEAEPEPKERRHEHIHQHVHNKVNKRRHGA